MFSILRSVGNEDKRLSELKREVMKRGYDRHASVLKRVSELPVELQSSAMDVLLKGEEVQAVLLFPAQIQRGWHYVPKQALLFTATGVIHLLASIWPEQEPQVTSLSGCGTMYVKVTLLLLYGYLEIVGRGKDSPTRLGMEFNTVGWHFLSAPLRTFLQASRTVSSIRADQITYAPTVRPAFEKLPFKFWNGVQLYGLLPGEELEELAFQEGTSKRWFYFFRQPITADTLLMLTTNYLVVIQEELGVKQGWVLIYIPRNSICGIQSRPGDLGNVLAIQLGAENQETEYKLLLANETVDLWRRQWVRHGGQWQDLSAQGA